MSQPFLETRVDKFIFRVHPDYLYDEMGIWIAMDPSSGIARLGLSDYRQQSSGDVAFVTLPAAGAKITAGQELCAVETIKVDLEVPAPVDGEVVAVNEALEESPELINHDPYGRGWLVELRPAAWPAARLLDAAAYLAVVIAQAEAESAA